MKGPPPDLKGKIPFTPYSGFTPGTLVFMQFEKVGRGLLREAFWSKGEYRDKIYQCMMSTQELIGIHNDSAHEELVEVYSIPCK